MVVLLKHYSQTARPIHQNMRIPCLQFRAMYLSTYKTLSPLTKKFRQQSRGCCKLVRCSHARGLYEAARAGASCCAHASMWRSWRVPRAAQTAGALRVATLRPRAPRRTATAARVAEEPEGRVEEEARRNLLSTRNVRKCDSLRSWLAARAAGPPGPRRQQSRGCFKLVRCSRARGLCEAARAGAGCCARASMRCRPWRTGSWRDGKAPAPRSRRSEIICW